MSNENSVLRVIIDPNGPGTAKMLFDGKDLAHNCESYTIIHDAGCRPRAELKMFQLATDMEIKEWELSLELMGTRSEQIKCLEKILKLVRAKKDTELHEKVTKIEASKK